MSTKATFSGLATFCEKKSTKATFQTWPPFAKIVKRPPFRIGGPMPQKSEAPFQTLVLRYSNIQRELRLQVCDIVRQKLDYAPFRRNHAKAPFLKQWLCLAEVKAVSCLLSCCPVYNETNPTLFQPQLTLKEISRVFPMDIVLSRTPSNTEARSLPSRCQLLPSRPDTPLIAPLTSGSNRREF